MIFVFPDNALAIDFDDDEDDDDDESSEGNDSGISQ